MSDRPKLLYVDDERLLRRAFARLVRDEWELFLAANAKEALALCEEHAFQVVVSDYQLPEMSGLDLFTALRPKLPDATFILVSGQFDVDQNTDDLERAYVAHAFSKPWDNRKFLALLRTLAKR
jgi:DNA-binding NtrC family response regulator